jgi:hypothetical protein
MKSLCSVLLALVAQTALPQMNPIAGQVGDGRRRPYYILSEPGTVSLKRPSCC